MYLRYSTHIAEYMSQHARTELLSSLHLHWGRTLCVAHKHTAPDINRFTIDESKHFQLLPPEPVADISLSPASEVHQSSPFPGTRHEYDRSLSTISFARQISSGSGQHQDRITINDVVLPSVHSPMSNPLPSESNSANTLAEQPTLLSNSSFTEELSLNLAAGKSS